MCVKYSTIMKVADDKKLVPNRSDEDIVKFCTKVLRNTTKDDLHAKDGVFQGILCPSETMVIPMAYFVIDKAVPTNDNVSFEEMSHEDWKNSHVVGIRAHYHHSGSELDEMLSQQQKLKGENDKTAILWRSVISSSPQQ